MRRGIAAVVLAAGLTSEAEAATVRLGLFVGNDVGFGDDEPLRYAEQEARDMARVFQSMGDLQRERTVVLQGATAGQLEDAMRSVEAQVREAVARGDEAMLVFYYSGHASREGLHLSGTSMPMDAIRRWLEASAARVRVAFVDACESGGLARTRGGEPTGAIEIRVDDALTMSGLAVVTSTGPLSVARESEAFGGAVFSRALLNGLQGSADTDGDGRVTLDEAYGHAFTQTVVQTATTADAVQRPEVRFDLAGVGDVVLTRIPERAAALTLPEELEGVYAVVSVSSGQVVARVDKEPGAVRRINLPPGRYVVRKVRREDVLVAELGLVWGGERWLDDAQMTAVPIGDPLARGGWSARPVRIGAHATGAAPFVDGNPAMLGGDAGVRVRLTPRLGVLLDVGYERGVRWEWSGRLRTEVGRAALLLHSERPLRSVDVGLGAGAEGVRLAQHVQFIEPAEEGFDRDELHAAQYTFGGVLLGSLHLPVGPVFGIDAGLRGHLYRALVDERWGARAEAQATLGVAARRGGPARVRSRPDEP